MFQDGGLVVMGANIFNMGVVGTLGGCTIYRAVASLLGRRGPRPDPRRRASRPGRRSCSASRAWRSSSRLSGTTPLGVALPAMVGVHVFIGIGEALITMAALAFIAATRRRPVQAARRRLVPRRRRGARAMSGADRADAGAPRPPASRVARRWWWVVGLAIAALVVIVLAPLASPDPDGLERVAEDQASSGTAQNAVLVIPDYTVPGIDGNLLDDPRRAARASLVVVGLMHAARRASSRADGARSSALDLDRYVARESPSTAPTRG